MLLIDDHQTKRRKLRSLGKECVGSDHERGVPIGGRRACRSALRCVGTTEHECYVNAKRGQESLRGCGVLAGEELRWSQKGGLVASGRRCSGGHEGDGSFTGAHITLQQAQHRRPSGKVGKYFVDGSTLICGPRCPFLCLGPADTSEDDRTNPGQVRFRWRDAECAATSSATTSMDQGNLHGKQFVKGQATKRCITKVKLLWPVERLNGLSERHKTVARLHLCRQRINQRRTEFVKKGSYRPPQAQRRHPTG